MREPSISRSSLTGMILVSWVSILLLGGVWTGKMYFDFLRESSEIRSAYYAERKALVQEQVRLGVGLVEEIRLIGMEDLRADVRRRADQAVALIDELSQGKERIPSERIVQGLAAMAGAGVSDGHHVFATFGDEMETVVLIKPAPVGLDAGELVKALKGVRYGERQVSLADENGNVCIYLLVIKESVKSSMRVVSGACLSLVDDSIKAKVVEELEAIQFGDGGYLFGGTWDGFSLVGPAKGKSMWNVVDVNGIKIVQELVAASKSGGGLVSYVMPEINGQRHSKKISYAMPIPDWEWYIGAGQYVDDIDAVVDRKRRQLKQEIFFQMIFIGLSLCALSLITYYISRRLGGRLRSGVQLFTQAWNRASTQGALVDLDGLHYGEFRELAVAANRMVEDRLIAEEKVSESVSRFKGLVSNLPGIVYQCGANDERPVYFIGDSVGDITGFSAEEFVEHRRSLASIVDSRDVSWVNQAVNHDILSHRPYSLEYRIVRKDGGMRWVLERGRAQYDDQGVPQVLDGVILDVTERRKAEEEHFVHMHFLETMERIDRGIRRNSDLDTMLGEVMETVRKAFDADRAWLLYPCDPEADSFVVSAEMTVPEFPGANAMGKPVKTSPEVREVFVTSLESPGPVAYDRETGREVPPDTAAVFKVKSQLVVALHPRVGKSWLMGLHQCSKDRVWHADEVRLFKEASRRISDTLSHQIMHSELMENEAKFRTFSEQTTLGICLVQDDVVKFANKAYCDIFEVSVEEMLALPPGGYIKFVHPNDQAMLLEQARKKQAGDPDQVRTYTWRAITATGRVRWVEIHSKTVYVEGRPADLISLLDITDVRRSRNELEQLVKERTSELEQQAAELQEANVRLTMLDELKSSFLTTVSQKLHAPLASVLGYAKLVQDDLKKATSGLERGEEAESGDSIAAYLHLMELEGERLGSFIDEFMVFTSIKAGTAVWADRSVDVGDLISSEVDKARFLLAGKPDVDVETGPVFDVPRLTIDPDRFSLVVRALLDNAIRYSQRGSILVHAEPSDTHGVRFSVSDTGKGIPESELDAVFEPFHRLETEDESVEGVHGPGLGLALARSIVEHYGGTIEVESYLGKGCTFHVEIPGTGVVSGI